MEWEAGIQDDLSSESVAHVDTLLREISLMVRKKGKEALSDYGVTPPQFHALLALKDGALSMGELCESMYLAPSTITDLVDRMEATELVERIRDPLDRRVVRIRIRDKGRRLLEEVLARRHIYLSSVLVHLSSVEHVQLVRILEKLHEIMFSPDKDSKKE